MKTHVVIECGTHAQIVLNAEEWRSIHRAMLHAIDPENDLYLSDVLEKNRNRTVQTNLNLRGSLNRLNTVMYNLSHNSAPDNSFRILLMRVLILAFHTMESGANLAFNFIDYEDEMNVFPRGGYVVGDLTLMFLGTLGRKEIPDTIGVFDFKDNKIAQFNTGTPVIDSEDGMCFQLSESRISIVPMYLLRPDELHRIMTNSTHYARYVFSDKPFRVSCQRNIFDLDKDTIYLGPVSFEVCHGKN